MRLRGWLLGALLLLPLPAAAEDLRDLLAGQGTPCREGAFTCVTLEVPRDHAHPDAPETLPVEFAVHLATGESKGLLFFAVGGPGSSGLLAADPYSEPLPELLQSMDLVFFDQRGVGPLTGVACPQAQGRFDTADLPLDREKEVLKTVKDFVAACLAELKDPALLPFLGTGQAIQDVEAFRQAIGAPKIWFYGESYGTQFVQQYAAAFPDALSGVILDGVVDLQRDAEDFYASAYIAMERLLARLLRDCDALPDCRDDMALPPEAAYDALAKRLAREPAAVSFPLVDGSLAQRSFTAGMLELTALYALYTPYGRTAFLRGLSAASRDDLVPLLRATYDLAQINPATGLGVGWPDYFGALYYANTCIDYSAPAKDPDEAARALLKRARTVAGATEPRLLRNYVADRLVCGYWPAAGDGARPPLFAGGDYPTLLLSSDVDPATPIDNAYGVFNRLRNGYLVTQVGGPHVIFGRGHDCPDRIVLDLMLKGKLPAGREQLCQVDFMVPYEPAAPPDPSDGYAIGRAVERALDWQLGPAASNVEKPLTVGCDHGGTVTASPTKYGVRYAFGNCAFWPDLILSGSGNWTEGVEGAQNGLALMLAVGGVSLGNLFYWHDSDSDARGVSGQIDGEVVEMPRPRP